MQESVLVGPKARDDGRCLAHSDHDRIHGQERSHGPLVGGVDAPVTEQHRVDPSHGPVTARRGAPIQVDDVSANVADRGRESFDPDVDHGKATTEQ